MRIPPIAGPSAAPSDARGDPDAERALVAALDVREKVERGGDDERGADRLNAARADEHVERRSEPARE